MSVAGRGSLNLLIDLCHSGFSQVECARQSTCRCADQASDVLLILGGTVGESLVSVLKRTARLLKDGGRVVLRLDDVDEDCAVQTCLASLGLEVTSTVFDLSDGVLVGHTVERRRLTAMAS